MEDGPALSREPHERAPTPRAFHDRLSGRSGSRLLALGGIILVVGALHLAKVVLVLVAFAALLAFLLGPLVVRVQRGGLPRVPAVMAVMGLALLIAVAIGVLVVGEVNSFVDKLPGYQETLRAKVDVVRAKVGRPLEKAQRTVAEITGTDSRAAPAEAAAPVTVVDTGSDPWEILKPAGEIFAMLGSIAVVVVLATILLIQKEDIRNRLLRLAGGGSLYATTQAFDDASGKVSRFLLMTSIVNGTLGACVGLGLFLIGVPNALLWGLLFALLRFIPYVGPWIGASLPVLTSLAVFPDWTPTLLTLGMLLVLELVTANVIEPWIYGARTGVSPGALIIAAVFWTWVWGVPGLFLATPLTVCLAVMGKHVPALRFLHVILGDEPVLSVHARLYQRLLARDADEAWDVVERELEQKDDQKEDGKDQKKESTRDQKHDGKDAVRIYDELLIPALVLAEREHDEGSLDPRAFEAVAQQMLQIVDEVEDRTAEPLPSSRAPVPVVCVGASDEADYVAAVMLGGLLGRVGFTVQVVPAATLTGEVVSIIRERGARLVFVSNVPPSGFTQIRYLCKRLSTALAPVEIVVGIWGSGADGERIKHRLPEAGSLHVATTLGEAVERARGIYESLTLESPPERKPHVEVHTPGAAV